MTDEQLRQSSTALEILWNTLTPNATDESDRKAAIDAIRELESIVDYEKELKNGTH